MHFAFLNSLLILLVFSCTNVLGQSLRSHEQGGEPYGLLHFSKDDLPNKNQNWSITQDNRGLIYVGNHAGVLEYDGNTWRLIDVAESNTAFSVAVDQAGIVYVGSRNDFGFLAPDSTGSMAYTSLLSHVASADLNFGIIWAISVTDAGIYFQANSHLFNWDGSRIKSWQSSSRLHTSFAVHNQFYVKRDSVGLLVVDGDSLTLIPGSEQFAQKRVFLMSPQGEDILLAAQEGLHGPLELYRYDGSAFASIAVDHHLSNKDYTYKFYHGSVLSNGYLALATLYSGVFIIDGSGELVETLDADRDVIQDVNSTFSDNQGGLWLAHNVSGISYVGSPLALSQYGDKEGLEGDSNSILRHQGRLYVATDNGLFRLRDRLQSEPEEGELQFEHVDASDNAKGLHWALLSYGDELLLGAEHGVWGVRNDEARFI